MVSDGSEFWCGSGGFWFWCGVQWVWVLEWCPVVLDSDVESSGSVVLMWSPVGQ